MPVWKNLSVIRKVVQLLAFLFLVYGSVFVGFYSADKISGAFPALACAYDAKTADYCVLIPLQHQLGHGVGRAIGAGTFALSMLLPVLTTLATFLLLFVLLNKAFCGWLCPLGFFQEVLGMIGQKLRLNRTESLDEKVVDRIRPAKWLMLGLLVILFPLASGIGFVGHELGDPFCKICPSRILTSLAAGQLNQLYIDTSSTGYMILSIIADTLFGLILVLSLTMRQPFCRICPMLAMHAIFKKIGLVRLVKNYTPRCDKCGLCAKACPMDIREIHTSKEKDILMPDCTLCGRCVEFCPDKGVMAMKYAVIPIKVSDPQYFKERNRAQKQWEGKQKPSRRVKKD
ncbi:4Fe-4S binding domain-containing protein [Mariprofundus ferrinatatus]|uniref:4Fe-4S binding domain-containing protein n=1 Tax=Mariprofundus ferrinatatus TaxID=1921087 RepID=A0A2K8L5G6_9PROT|nr:4Fe-4S binding protein [Mariprofundus ferrinatatus]ATX82352.1 4Fe-4S binding domain-containing protein [Mariprofundus ferrinatatus]